MTQKMSGCESRAFCEFHILQNVFGSPPMLRFGTVEPLYKNVYRYAIALKNGLSRIDYQMSIMKNSTRPIA